jgi:hypothetical protein
MDGTVKKATGREGPGIRTSFKVAFAVILAVIAAIIGYTKIVRTQPAQAAVIKAFGRAQAGDMEGVMELVDPESQLGTMWKTNEMGIRDKFESILAADRLDFSSLKFNTRAQNDTAEVDLKGGRLTIYSRSDPAPVAVVDLAGSDLAFYVEKKEGLWLIEGINQDLSQILSQDQFLSPF